MLEKAGQRAPLDCLTMRRPPQERRHVGLVHVGDRDVFPPQPLGERRDDPLLLPEGLLGVPRGSKATDERFDVKIELGRRSVPPLEKGAY